MLADINLFDRGTEPLVALGVSAVLVAAVYYLPQMAAGRLRLIRPVTPGRRVGTIPPLRVLGRVIRHPVLLLAVAALAPTLSVYLGRNADVTIIFGVATYVMLATGLNIVVGYTGLLDLGYVAFYAVGAYTFALLGSSQLYPILHRTIYILVPAGSGGDGLHISMWLVLPVAGLLAAAFGALIGYPTLRLRGDYLAIVTLGFGEITRLFAQNLFQPINITNGPLGIIQIDPIWIADYNFGIRHELFGFEYPAFLNYYYVILVVVLITIFFVSRLASSRVGRAWAAIREDELAAEASGINTRNLKLLAYASGGFFGGVTGALFASAQHFIDPNSFGFFFSILVLVMVVVGGMGNIYGVILGATVVGLAYFYTGQFGSLRVLMFGIVLVFMIIIRPQGMLPSRQRQRELATADLTVDIAAEIAPPTADPEA